jgi:hypothetical protein
VRGVEVCLDDLGSANRVLVNDVPMASGTTVRLHVGDWFRVGNHEFGLHVAEHERADRLEVTGNHETLRSPAIEGKCRGEGEDKETLRDLRRFVDPIEAMEASGRKWMTDASLPLLDRFQAALQAVESLVYAGAHAPAQRLLAEAVDLVRGHGAMDLLPPTTSARVAACLGHWIDLLEDPRWAERREALLHERRSNPPADAPPHAT